MTEVCSGWWVVEEEETEGLKVRTIVSVDKRGMVKHEDFAFTHSVAEMRSEFGYEFIRLIDLWQEATC